MGQRGPKPKPAALKLLGGRPAAQPPTGRGRVRNGIPDRPAELTGEAAAEWDRVAPELHAAGLLAFADRGILSAYCLAVADMLAARAAILADGRLIRTPVQTSTGQVIGESVKEHPACRMLDRASSRVRALAESLGLTPASRSRLEGGSGEDPPRVNAVDAIRERIQQARTGG